MMKISNGNWLLQAHLEVMNPVYFFRTEPEEQSLRVIVATKDIHAREAQLDVPVFTYTFQASGTNALRVRLAHFEGVRPQEPHFRLQPTKQTLMVQEDEQTITVQNGRLRAVLYKKDVWHIDYFFADAFLTRSDCKSAGYAFDKRTNLPYVFEQLHLSVNEHIYGLGERFGALVKNGQAIEIWNRDGGTSTEQAYKNIPFYLSSRNYGVFIEQPERVELEVASEKVSEVQFSVQGESLIYHIIGGESPKQVLTNYTARTGRPPRLPAWSYGLWLSTSFTTNYDAHTVNSFIDGMEERHIPLHVFHFDCFWMEALKWCNFTWDKNVFPHPKALLASLKQRGLHICVWINPYVSQQSELFAEGMTHHYFIERENGDVWQWDRWQPGLAIIDFTNPSACYWYEKQLEKLLDMGVDCFKTDFGERIPVTGVKYFNNASPARMHNFYTYLYNQTVFKVLKHKRGENEAVLFARSATAGSQTMPVHWGGDCHGTYESMAETLRGGLSLGMSGFGYWSHDIGGFEHTSPADVYKRWCAFGLLSSHSRLHGSQSYRVPWNYDEEAVAVLRHFVTWKCRLMPYLYQLGEKAHTQGLPILRAMFLEFPQDPACAYLDQQYMLGNALLVAPIFRRDGKALFYLPAGTWTHLFTRKQVTGGTWREETHDFMSLPLYIRPNCILPLGCNTTRPDYAFTANTEFYLPVLEDGKTARVEVTSLHRQKVAEVCVKREGSCYRVDGRNLGEACTLHLPRGNYKISASTMGNAEKIAADVFQLTTGDISLIFTNEAD